MEVISEKMRKQIVDKTVGYLTTASADGEYENDFSIDAGEDSSWSVSFIADVNILYGYNECTTDRGIDSWVDVERIEAEMYDITVLDADDNEVSLSEETRKELFEEIEEKVWQAF